MYTYIWYIITVTTFWYIQFANGAPLNQAPGKQNLSGTYSVYASYRLAVRPFYNQESCMDACVSTVSDGLFELL